MTPEEALHAEIRAALIESKIRPEIIYAFDQTGRLVTEDNAALLTPAERQEWDDAIAEYRRAHPEETS